MAPSAPIVDVSVVIVNYNVRDFLEQAIRSIYRAATRLTVEILVVDNASSDGSMEMVAERFPAVRRLENAENVGFGRANNQAIQVARGRYILVLNPDTIVQEDTLEQLCQLMDNRPDVGAAGCMILNPDGSFALESR
ncbi:MAG: glycosyltransferase family 2 protein, partial [Bacteroidetes bacterium]|nr:glycosyltransferase family 2 protein [Bacteroidota bacterium]